MNSLPSGLRKRIFLALARVEARSAFPQLCTVSRECQEVFEIFIFAEINLNTKRLGMFNEIVLGQRRRSYVQSIILRIELDSYDEDADHARETDGERHRSRQVFTTIVESFLHSMARWKNDDRSPYGIVFHLSVYSPSDLPEKERVSVRSQTSQTLTHRAQSSPLKLDPSVEALPFVNLFTGFRCTGRHVLPTSIIEIISRLRELSFIDVKISHDSGDGRDMRQRKKFTEGLQHHGRTLTKVTLHRPSGASRSTRPPDKHRIGAIYSGLRRFSEQLVSLTFDDCVDASELFSPFMHAGGHPSSLPYWDRLERLSIRNSYLTKRPYMRASNRTEALASIFKLLFAVGRGVRHMPNLKKARICQYMLTDDSLEWFIVTYKFVDGRASLDVQGLKPSRLLVDVWQQSVTATRGLELKLAIYPSEQNIL